MSDQMPLINLPSGEGAYRIADAEKILTPALAIYPQIVDENISATLRLLGGDPNRWRPHVKTSKLAFIMKRLVQRGIMNFKCATTLEFMTACEVGAPDVLFAYPAVGTTAQRVRELARQFPATRMSALVENVEQIQVPRHICPTVNNFDYAVIVIGGRVAGVERVTARGREAPLAESLTI